MKYHYRTGVKRSKKAKRFGIASMAAVFTAAFSLVPLGFVLANGGGHHNDHDKHHIQVVTPCDLALAPCPAHN